MPNLDRHRLNWTGFIGAPGVSTFYVIAGTNANPFLHDFFDTIKAYLPQDVTIQVEATGDTLDYATGALVGAWSGTSVSPVVGTSANAYSAVTGALVRWGSATFLSGRRLRGHTF